MIGEKLEPVSDFEGLPALVLWLCLEIFETPRWVLEATGSRKVDVVEFAATLSSTWDATEDSLTWYGVYVCVFACCICLHVKLYVLTMLTTPGSSRWNWVVRVKIEGLSGVTRPPFRQKLNSPTPSSQRGSWHGSLTMGMCHAHLRLLQHEITVPSLQEPPSIYLDRFPGFHCYNCS